MTILVKNSTRGNFQISILMSLTSKRYFLISGIIHFHTNVYIHHSFIGNNIFQFIIIILNRLESLVTSKKHLP